MKQKTIKNILVCILLVLGIVSVFVYVRGNNNKHSFKNVFSKHRRHPVLLSDVIYIAEWMTFDYVNNVFELPSSYLQTSLHIEDAKYPFITLRQYAKRTNQDIPTLISDIRSKIKEYVKPESSSE